MKLKIFARPSLPEQIRAVLAPAPAVLCCDDDGINTQHWHDGGLIGTCQWPHIDWIHWIECSEHWCMGVTCHTHYNKVRHNKAQCSSATLLAAPSPVMWSKVGGGDLCKCSITWPCPPPPEQRTPHVEQGRSRVTFCCHCCATTATQHPSTRIISALAERFHSPTPKTLSLRIHTRREESQ